MASKIHKTIRKLRIVKNVSQDVVAQYLGISHSAYGKLERGGTNLAMDRLEKLAVFFDVSFFEIVNFENSPINSVIVKDSENVAPEALKTDEVSLLFLKEKITFLEQNNDILRAHIADRNTLISLLSDR